MNIFTLFWGAVIFTSITWYAFLVFYVGYKAGREIKQMTSDLQQRNSPPDNSRAA